MVGVVQLAADADGGVSIRQIITVASIALTIATLGFSLWKGLKRSRLRPMLDVARVVVQSAAAVAVPALTGVTTSPLLILLPAFAGLLLGVFQGRALQIDVDGDRIFATRSIVGFSIWGFGLVLMQGAGLANRVGVLQVGQAITWFSIGITVGLILGRHDGVNRALSSVATGVAPMLVAVLLLGGCFDAAELNVVVNEDGSGTFEAALGSFPSEDEDRQTEDECTSEGGGYAYEEFRDGLDWCVFGVTFPTVEGLRSLLLSFNVEQEVFRVDCLALQDGRALLDMTIIGEDSASSDEEVPLPISVTVPGPIDTTNGSQTGNRVTWVLTSAAAVGSPPTFNMRINTTEETNCPTNPVALNINTLADGTGSAIASLPVLGTGAEDNLLLVDALTAAGWQTAGPAENAATFTATTSWEAPESMGASLERTPFLVGSRFQLELDPNFPELYFDAFVDLTGYDVYWAGINPEIQVPPFTISYFGEGAVSSATGDWTDPVNLVFEWSPGTDDGLLHGLTASTTTDPGAIAAAEERGRAEAERIRDQAEQAGDDAPAGDGFDEAAAGDGGDDAAAGDTGGAQPGGALPGAGGTDQPPPDNEDVTENEALNAAIAGLLAAAAAGLITAAEAAEAIARLTEAADANAAERAAQQAEEERQRQVAAEAERQRLLDLHQQTFDRLVEALPHGIPFEEWDAEIDAIRDRIRAGTATPADIERMTQIRDQARSVYLDADTERLATHQTTDRILAAGEWSAWAGTVGAKAAAGALGGPVAGGIVTGLVDGAGAAHLGWDKAVATGVANGIVDGVTGGLLADLNRLGLTQRVGRAGLANGAAAAAQNYWAQLVANNGDASKVDMEQVQNAGLLGMGVGGVTGAATPRIPDTPQVSGVRPTTFGGDDVGHGWGQRTTPGADDVRPTTFGDDATGRGWGQNTTPDAPTPTTGSSPDLDAPTPTTGSSPDLDAPTPTTGSSPDLDAPTTTAATAEADDLLAAQQRAVSPTETLPASGTASAGPDNMDVLSRWETLGANGRGEIYDSNGHLLGRVDNEGNIWTPSGEPIASVETGFMTTPTGYRTPDGRRIQFRADGTPIEIRDGNFLDAPDVPRPPPTPRAELADSIRTRWDQAGAGPNGELFGPNGQQIGTIDSAGRMTTLDGREITYYGEPVAGRLSQVRTADGQLHGELPQVQRPPAPAGPSDTNVADVLNAPPRQRVTPHTPPAGADTNVGTPAQTPGTDTNLTPPPDTTIRQPTNPDTHLTTPTQTPGTDTNLTPPPDTTLRAAAPPGGIAVDAEGIAASPSGQPTLRLGSDGAFQDLNGQPVSNVVTRDGRIAEYTDASGQRWILG